MGYGYASNGHVYLEHQNLRESDAPGSSSKLSHPDDSSSTRKTYGWWRWLFFFFRSEPFIRSSLVGGCLTYPSEKWWSESQLGWWHPQYMEEKNMFQTTNQISVSNDFWQSTLRLQCFENGGLSDTDEPPPFADLYQRIFPLLTFIWSSLFQWWNHLQSFVGPQSPIINHSSSSIYIHDMS